METPPLPPPGRAVRGSPYTWPMSNARTATPRKPVTLGAALGAFLVWVSVATAAPQTWTLKSNHYEIVTDLDRNAIRDIASHMDAVAAEYERVLSGFAVRNAMRNRLYVFRTREAYLAFMGEIGFDARNTGGVFFVQMGQSGLATWTEARARSRMYHVLQHEGFHQFASARIGDALPTWANEGLAEYFGQALIVRGRLQTGLVPGARLEQVKQAIRNENTFPFTELVLMPHERWNQILQSGDPRAGLMYSQAWSMVHFLVHANNGRYARSFEQYIKLIAQGKTNDQALIEAFGGNDLDAFEQAWKAYTLEIEPDAVSLAVERLEFLGAGLEALHEEGVEIQTLEDLKSELKRRKFRLAVQEHAVVRMFTAEDDDLFAPPPSPTRRPARIELIASRRSSHASRQDLPPMIDVTGLGPHIRLHWSRDEESNLVSEISMQ